MPQQEFFVPYLLPTHVKWYPNSQTFRHFKTHCGNKDAIEHSLIECVFTKLFTQNVLDWFNQVNGCQISPTTEETLFGITTSSLDTSIIRKFNYTALFMRHYIYLSKLNSLAISIQDFISKLLIEYEFEFFSLIG